MHVSATNESIQSTYSHKNSRPRHDARRRHAVARAAIAPPPRLRSTFSSVTLDDHRYQGHQSQQRQSDQRLGREQLAGRLDASQRLAQISEDEGSGEDADESCQHISSNRDVRQRRRQVDQEKGKQRRQPQKQHPAESVASEALVDFFARLAEASARSVLEHITGSEEQDSRTQR